MCLVADSNAVIVIEEGTVVAAILVMIILAPVKAEFVVDVHPQLQRKRPGSAHN